MTSLPYFAPLFLLFEVWQLIMSERYLGIKQIARGADPRSLGLGEVKAFVWTSCIVTYTVWAMLLVGIPFTRAHGLGLLAITTIGYLLRRGVPLRWVLIVLTFEGAIRIGLLVALCGRLWLRR